MSEPLVELVAVRLHNIWWQTTLGLVKGENISDARREVWQKLWVPYNMLPEEMKEVHRKQARVILGDLTKWLEHTKTL